MHSSDLRSDMISNGGLRIRVVGLGGWGARAVQLFAAQGVPSHAVPADGRGLAADPELGRMLAGSEDELLVIVGQAGSETGALLGSMLELAAESAPAAGRLVIARLPGVQSAPDDRARGLVALNALLQAPEASILLVQPSRGMGISAESEAAEALKRLIRLLELPARENEAGGRLSPWALQTHLATPGFAGWREIELTSEMCGEDASGWMENLAGAGAAWQPEGFAWADAQSVLPVARLPREWIDAGGRVQFDRFVQEAWNEAAPCAIARALLVGESPMAMVLSTGLSYPEALLELRDSVQADRERLAEKRRAAATPIPLGDDFLPGGGPVGPRPAARPRAVAGEAAREPREGPAQPSTGGGPAPPRMEERTAPEARSDRSSRPAPTAEPMRTPGSRPADEHAAAALSHEDAPAPLEFQPEGVEVQAFEAPAGIATATEAEEAEPETEAEVTPVEEPVAPSRTETPAVEEPIPASPPRQPAAEEPAAVEPPAEEPAAEEPPAEDRVPAGEPAPRIAGAPRVSPYESALSLASRVLNAEDLATEVDLGEIRYALYDLLEVVRDRPGPMLTEVFRRSETDYFERHHVNVAILSILTADQLGATLSDIIDLGTAAMLHDIGMSDSREAWDADVRLAPKVFDTTIRQHPERGHERLKQIPGMTPDIARIVREEHERLDGTGYPEGLSGDAIDPGARIVAVADTLEALTHARPYRERLSLGEALSRLQILGQYTLDMAVVHTLTDALTEFMPSLETGSDEA